MWRGGLLSNSGQGNARRRQISKKSGAGATGRTAGSRRTEGNRLAPGLRPHQPPRRERGSPCPAPRPRPTPPPLPRRPAHPDAVTTAWSEDPPAPPETGSQRLPAHLPGGSKNRHACSGRPAASWTAAPSPQHGEQPSCRPQLPVIQHSPPLTRCRTPPTTVRHSSGEHVKVAPHPRSGLGTFL